MANPYVNTIPEAGGTFHASLQGKTVLLTGIGQSGDPSMWGNGAATARILCANGARVFGCDLDLSRAQATRKRVQAEGGVCEAIACDVTDSSQVEDFVRRGREWGGGRVDILVNNVGMSEKGGPAEMDERTWDRQMDVNLKSVYLLCHSVLPTMEEQGSGVVVNVSSVAGLRYIGKPQVAYAATKAAVLQFTRATAVMYAPKGVRMNAVVPGLMHTPLLGMLADKYAGGDLEGFVKTRDAQVPTGKMGTSFDVANTTAWLCSDASKYVTGTEIVVDGAIVQSTGRV